MAVGLWVAPQYQAPAKECPTEVEGWQSLGFESGRRGKTGGCHFRWPESELLRWSVGAAPEKKLRLHDQERQGCPGSLAALLLPLQSIPHTPAKEIK